MTSSTVQSILTITQKYTISNIFIIRFIGNVLNILIFTKLKTLPNNQSTFYLMVESVVNLASVIYNFILHTLYIVHHSNISQRFAPWSEVGAIISQAILLISLFTICLAAIDQYLSTSYSIRLRRINTMSSTRYLMVIAVCLALTHSIRFEAFFRSESSVSCSPSYSILIDYYSYFFFIRFYAYYNIWPIIMFIESFDDKY